MQAIQITDGRTSLWQWDTGVRLKVYGCTDVDQMHFVTPAGVISKELVDGECGVPDTALQTDGLLKMYAFDRTANGGVTRCDFLLMIKARPKPADYIDPPDEYDNLAELAKRVAPLIPGGGGSVTPEQIGAAVEEYLAENPVEGKPGPPGPPGADGSDATVTAENVAAALGYTPANAETVSALSKEIVAVTPKKFGAVGDGVADDSDAIQSALNVGGLVYLPAGRYKITKTLTIGSNTTLMGDGDNSVIFLGDNGANLTPHYWYAEGEVDGVYPDYYPYITTAENAKDICISRIRVEGNTEEASENIHVGICAESATGVQIDHVSVWKINYFPELAPARPSGQWRRGWNVAFLRSERIELAHSTIQYGAYECVRIGTRTNDVWVHDCLIEYGWRTGLQVIEACNDVLVERCTINQDDFDAYDTNACITFHPSDANHIGAVVIRGCKLTGKLYTGTAEGAGISVVYNAIDSLVIDDCTIKITSAGLPAILAFDNTKISGCTIVSAAAALALQNELVFPLCVENCTINATGDKAAVVISGNVRIRGCTIDAASNHCVYAAPVDFASHLEISDSVINAPGTLNAVAIIKAANNSSTLGVSFDLDNNLLNGAIYINQPDVNLMRKCAIYGNTINVPAGKACVQNDYSSTAYKLLLINNNVMNGGNQAVKIWSAGMAIIKDNDMAGCTAGVAATNENNIIKDNILPG